MFPFVPRPIGHVVGSGGLEISPGLVTASALVSVMIIGWRVAIGAIIRRESFGMALVAVQLGVFALQLHGMVEGVFRPGLGGSVAPAAFRLDPMRTRVAEEAVLRGAHPFCLVALDAPLARKHPAFLS